MPNYFWKLVCWEISESWNRHFLKLCKRREPKNPWYCCNMFWQSWMWDQYLSKKHEMETWEFHLKLEMFEFSSMLKELEELKVFSIRGIPPTPPHSDSHPCISPPLWFFFEILDTRTLFCCTLWNIIAFQDTIENGASRNGDRIRRPLFRGAPRLRISDPLAFSQLAVIAIQLSAYSFMSLEGPKTRGSPSPDPECEIWDFIRNRFVFKLVFEA